MYDDVRQILGDMHTLLAGIQAGKGTAGKLVASDEFGDQIKATMGKVDALLDKMNNGTGTIARLTERSRFVRGSGFPDSREPGSDEGFPLQS